MAATSAVFDKLAEHYDVLWSDSPIGRHQRQAVWRRLDPLFQRGDRLLDAGCGTGTDAMHFTERGVTVHGVDASGEMVRIARRRGLEVRHLTIERLHEIGGRYDGVLSNFGALNCIANLEPVARTLALLVRPRGHLAICLAGPCCAWETLYYLRRLQPGKAFRRWHPGGCPTSLGVRVQYPTIRRLARTFHPEFRLRRWYGIGLLVPPSYVGGLPEKAIASLAAADCKLAHLPVLRALCDHRLLVFQRI